MKRKILIQLDTDSIPSVFDRVVAVDAGAEELFSYGGVTPADLRGIVHGAIFTRGPQDLHATAIFIGGSDVAAGEALLAEARKHFFGKLRVSILLDSNGANTTAAAAVLCAAKHVELSTARALVLGGTGPVGQRVARMLLRRGTRVRLGSRSLEKGRAAVARILARPGSGSVEVEAVATGGAGDLGRSLEGVSLVIAAGGSGVALLPAASRRAAGGLKALVDLNAVAPAGIEGVGMMDNAVPLDGAAALGAIAVGGFKMKIHKAAVASLFESGDRVLDAEEILDLGTALGA